jgi:perosamine synthetase
MIPVNRPNITELDQIAVGKVMSDGWVSSEAPVVKKFEKSLASFIGKKYCCVVSSGTAAIDIAWEALEVDKNDAVGCANFTIISCINNLLRKKVKLGLIGPGVDSYNIDVDSLVYFIQNFNPKAVCIPHIFGIPADIEKISKICKKYNVILLEDFAQNIGNSIGSKMIGSYGDISVCSFYPNKMITTGEGGAIFTDDIIMHEKFCSLRNLSFQKEKRFVHESIGWNYRISAMQAALGLSQLRRVDEHKAKKIGLAEIYYRFLSGSSLYKLPLKSEGNRKNDFWVFPILLPSVSVHENLVEFLSVNSVGWRPFFFPLSEQPIVKNIIFKEDKKSLEIYSTGLYVPIGVGNTKEEVREVCRLLETFEKDYLANSNS